MSSFFIATGARVGFASGKFAKVDLARGDHLMTGLNCFEPGQAQAVHAHAGADKFYLVLEGKARMRVGPEEAEVGPGTLVWAPAGVPHGVLEAAERCVMLIGMSLG
jgi:quercetin dioxygenase-like cupin family protein